MMPTSNITDLPLAPLALTMGDPAGVGPEIIAASWAARMAASLPPFFVIGDAGIIAAAAKALSLDVPVTEIEHAIEAEAIFGSALPVLNCGDARLTYTPGAPNDAGAKAAFAALKMGAKLALNGKISAIVTAPVAKENLARIGFSFPGQTEFLAHACGLAPEDCAMMLAGPSLRTVPLTIHTAIAVVPKQLTEALIISRARIVARALAQDFGIANPRLAFTGLNPHCGENGAFGDEEARIIIPAINALIQEGIDARGPFAADSLFAPHERAAYDAALCMYHDQALIPIKALDFDEGVNVTLGLPIIRTSPDHGTAFGIAGKGVARPNAMIAAIKMAASHAHNRAAIA